MALHDINMALQFESVILIQKGKIIASGDPEAVLTRDMVKQAFDVNVEIRRSGTDGIHVSYEDDF
jgi:iron complex transport system ATP-binding protein